MNERIKQIAEKATVYKERLVDGKHDIEVFDKEKFAELLVLEFAQLVEDNIDPHNAWITPDYVKQHFGVKE